MRFRRKTEQINTTVLKKVLEQETGHEVVLEKQFHPDRKWRFDMAIPDLLVAIELEGGVWTRGRHTRGAGFLKDVEKYNAGTVLGWRILRYAHVEHGIGQILEDVKAIQITSKKRYE